MKKQYTIYLDELESIGKILIDEIDSASGAARQQYIRELLSLGYLARKAGFGEIRGSLIHVPELGQTVLSSTITMGEGAAKEGTIRTFDAPVKSQDHIQRQNSADSAAQNAASSNVPVSTNRRANLKALSGRT